MLDWSYEYQDNICQQITPKTKTNFKKCKTLLPFHLNIICLQLKKQTNKKHCVNWKKNSNKCTGQKKEENDGQKIVNLFSKRVNKRIRKKRRICILAPHLVKHCERLKGCGCMFEPLGENKKASILEGRDYTRKNKQKLALTPLPVKDKKRRRKKIHANKRKPSETK